MSKHLKKSDLLRLIFSFALSVFCISCGGSEKAIEVYGESRTFSSLPTAEPVVTTSKLAKPPLTSVVVIGDSLTVGTDMYGISLTQSLLDAGVLDVVVSAENGRMTSEGIDELERSNVEDGAVVVALGTNDVAMGDPNRFGELIDRAMLAVPENVKVFWLNLYTDQWVSDDAYNATIDEKASNYSNLVVMDFEDFASTDWLEEDGVHLTPYGYTQRTAFILEELGLS